MIRFSLLLIFASIPVFLVAELLLWLTVPGFPDALTMLASVMLLTAFLLLIIAGLIGIVNRTALSLVEYFSAKQRSQRQFWFAKNKQDQLKRLFYFKTIRIWHVSELRRKHLLKRNNQKHIRSLARAINQELLSIKAKLSSATYQQLQQDTIRFKKKQDIESLLKLQQKISTFV